MINIFQLLITKAITSGVSTETIVLLLLLPLVTSIVAASRHLVGFRGFGILIPTAIAVVFVATGVASGILIFLTILFLASFARIVLRYLKIQYLPRMALVLWFVSLGVLTVIFLSPTAISIFPILILILLAEEFIEVQISKSLSEAVSLTLLTIIIALVGYAIFSFEPLQRFALGYPEVVILAPVFLNLFLGRFTGLRLLEYRRFRRLLEK
jgi:hypothetical protein